MPECHVYMPEPHVTVAETRASTPEGCATTPEYRAGLTADLASILLGLDIFRGLLSHVRLAKLTIPFPRSTMARSIDFIKARALKTISAAQHLAGSWTWQEKSLAQMGRDLEDLS